MKTSKKADAVSKRINDYRRCHNWDKSDSLEALVKSVYIEAVELLENFQPNLSTDPTVNIREELADVFMYAISLCDDLNEDYKDIVIKRIMQK